MRAMTISGAAMLLLTATAVIADPVSVEALVEPTEQMKFEFPDGSKHFVLAVRREGTATGTGMFADSAVTEFGWHDITPPAMGNALGYLQLTSENGDIAVLKWTVRAIFIKSDDKPALFDNGVWELVSGTGQFEGKRGVGSLVIKPAGGDKRQYILEGEIGDAP